MNVSVFKNALLNELPGDNSLTLLHERFKRLWRAYKFKVLSFGEMLETKSVFKVAFKMVPFSSAGMKLLITLSKFRSHLM